MSPKESKKSWPARSKISLNNNEPIVTSIIKDSPLVKTRAGMEKKILKKALLQKYGS